MKKFILKRIILVAVAAAILVPLRLPVRADWYDDVRSGTKWVEIEGSNFVADTFCGVNAYYNERNAHYQCNELINRFYPEVFGLDILAYSNTGLVMLTEGYDFKKQTPPFGAFTQGFNEKT